MANKIPRFSMAKINVPVVMGFENDKHLMMLHRHHGRSVLTMQHQANDKVKCIPLGWDFVDISDWGLEIPAPMLTVEASPREETKLIIDCLGEDISLSVTKGRLEQHGIQFTDSVDPEGLTHIYIPRWSCKAVFNIKGELDRTEGYTPATPVTHLKPV